MKPQTIKYGNGHEVVRLDDTHTFLVDSSKLLWGPLFPPTIFVEGIEDDRVKFDFYKAYSNKDGVVLHCEYRSVHGEKYKLIVHTQ